MSRLPITKTPKVYVGGAFIRSESARVFPLKDAAGNFFGSISNRQKRGGIRTGAKSGGNNGNTD